MNKKQNIATTLLLLLWAAMFCFSVFFTLHKQPTPQVQSYTSYQNKEKLTSEDQGIPIAWTEPSSHHVISSAAESDLTIYTSVFWSINPEALFLSPKPVKSILAFASVTSLFGIQPNAP